MKLEIKHLAAYLPYNLELIFEKSGRIINMMYCHNEGSLHIVDIGEGNTYDLKVWNFKPILLPLSELPSYSNGLMHMGYQTDNISIDDIVMKIKAGYCEYDIMEMCFEEHIDCFGLIDAGIAIDKNTLNKK